VAGEDLKTFIREITRRNEIVWNEVRAELQQGTLALIDLRGQIARQTREIDDHRDETRAQTQAVLRLLDRRSRGED
jgi:hypothetical protein